MKNKLIIVVDCQYDFINPDGALYVKGAEEAIDNIKKLLSTITADDLVIFTADNHPINHCSFIDNGGIWPTHCVNFRRGSEIDLDLQELAGYSLIVTKGEDPDTEEYSGFKNNTYQLLSPDRIKLNNVVISEVDKEEIIICGVAGDFCVLETLKTFHEVFPEVKVYLPGVASIDGGSALTTWMMNNEVEQFKL